MKLRLTTDSVRLRCRRSEVEAFGREGRVFSSTTFPGGQTIRFGLVSAQVTAPAIKFSDEGVVISVPQAEAQSWTTTSQVGIYGKEGNVELMVEKDFRRTSKASPDDDDRYPNPRAQA